VWHFLADAVSDVAWATANHSVWQAARAAIPGRHPIPLHLFYVPGNAEASRERGFARGRHTLAFYSQLWLPYAFPQLIAVDGPERAMEYPMLTMSGADFSDHEVGHE